MPKITYNLCGRNQGDVFLWDYGGTNIFESTMRRQKRNKYRRSNVFFAPNRRPQKLEVGDRRDVGGSQDSNARYVRSLFVLFRVLRGTTPRSDFPFIQIRVLFAEILVYICEYFVIHLWHLELCVYRIRKRLEVFIALLV